MGCSPLSHVPDALRGSGRLWVLQDEARGRRDRANSVRVYDVPRKKINLSCFFLLQRNKPGVKQLI
jgi:hypothetical protein